ncbi:DUF4190 domain-containing protein [Streptomyces sp. J2-1]|nr:DUF4190 domain-containing protein [Streptomyces corallincola]
MAAVPGGDFGAPGAVPPVPATPAASYPPPGAPGAYPPPGASAPYAGQTPTGYPQGPGGYGYPGQPQGYGGGWPGMPMAPQNQLGTAAMVLGILSICLFCVYGVLSLILGIIAVVLGVQGKKRADRGEATNRGQAQAGLITGVIGIVIGVAVITSLIVAFVYAARHDDDGGVGDDPYYNSAPRISAPYQPQG